MVTCKGFTVPLSGNLYENFPFQLMKVESDFVFESGRFHDKQCFMNGYDLFNTEPLNNDINNCCAQLLSKQKLQKYIDNPNEIQKHLTTATNIYLTYSQLSKRIHNLQNSLNVERLKSLNKDQKLYSLNKSIELHQRFMMLIKESSTPNLHELVKVAISSKRSLEYIIVDSVDGIYNPHSSEDDKDLAFIILHFGGPGLLNIVHRALNFPSTSTPYRILKNSGSCTNSSVNTPMNKFVDNISTSLDNPFHGYMLEIDETYTEVKARWNPGDNKLYGICHELGKNEDLTFTSYDHPNMVKANILHVPKETVVIACSSNSINSNVQVVAALPTCSKNEIEYQANLIDSISTNFAEKHGAPLLN